MTVRESLTGTRIIWNILADLKLKGNDDSYDWVRNELVVGNQLICLL